jgi:PAS domain-containing protein
VEDPVVLVSLGVTALLSALAGVLGLAAFQSRKDGSARALPEQADRPEFLFDGESLLDATPSGRALLRHSPLADGPAWMRLVAWLEPRFPGVAARIETIATEGRITMASGEGDSQPWLLSVEDRGGLLRIALAGPAVAGEARTDPATHRAAEEELARLRAACDGAPLPLWQEDDEGRILWANAAYHRLAAAGDADGGAFVWPLPRLFERTPASAPAGRQRQRVDPPGQGARWFDIVSAAPGAQGRIHYALPADSTVQAEAALGEFMQTLTKTFAQLRTGLAIFDRDRKLQLFNPALVDLTSLPPEMLSARPRLTAFLDALRERSMIPEPRDWHGWRSRLDDLEKAAATGLHDETWTLPGGQTYRVTARPHPNGALALMVEDISTEMSQTRRYRADLELGQAVIDAMDEAIAVFSPAGMLVMSNTAYAALWGHDPGATLNGGAGVASICAHWRDRSAPSTIWDRAEDFVARMGSRDGWADLAHLSDGRAIWCRFDALAGGATLAGFRSLPDPDLSAARPENRETA